MGSIFGSIRYQIPTSCLPTLLIFIHIEHICSFFVAFFSATINGRNLIFGHKLHIGTSYRGKRFWTHQIPTSCFLTLLIFIHIEHTFCICPFLVAFFSATTKTGRHDIAEILLKVALNTKNQIKYMLVFYLAFYCRILITFIHHKNAKY